MLFYYRVRLRVFIILVLFTSFTATAQVKQSSLVALTISGKLDTVTSYKFSEAEIMALPQHSFFVVDPWDGKMHEFTGVLLAELLSRAGILKSATKITAIAVNNYEIPIRRVDYERYGYLLAWKIDGHLFAEEKATKNRGFLSIAVDFTSHPELDPELIKHQLVWQLNQILVE